MSIFILKLECVEKRTRRIRKWGAGRVESGHGADKSDLGDAV